MTNHTLRVPRTSREAFGYEVNFHDADKWDRRVFVVALVSFLLGFLIGSAA